METISDISIIDSNTAEAIPVESGLERTLCSEDLCSSKNLTVYRRTILAGRQFDLEAGVRQPYSGGVTAVRRLAFARSASTT